MTKTVIYIIQKIQKHVLTAQYTYAKLSTRKVYNIYNN